MKILLAVDDSKFSEAATRAVAALIRPQEAQVLLLHIVEPRFYSVPPQMSPGCSPETAEIRKEQRKAAEEAVGRNAQALRNAGFQVETRVGEGEPRSGILDIAAEWHADIIVLGSHGRAGLQRLLLGRVAETVARHARCSVMIVRIP